MSDFSIEVTPRDVGSPGELAERLRPGRTVYLTWLPGSDSDVTVSAARRLREAGLRPVPHISARDLRGEADLRSALSRFTGDAGVDEVLLVGGGNATPNGPFSDSLALLRTGALQEAGVRAVGVAGYPEGTPVAPADTVSRFLVGKLAYAADEGLAASVVSQFCFDGEHIASWIASLRHAGIEVPLRVGFAGVTSLERLIRFATRCGVGASTRLLRKEARNVLRMTRVRTPGELVSTVAAAPFSGVRAHFFSLGSFDQTAEWCEAVADGRFRVDDGEVVADRRDRR